MINPTHAGLEPDQFNDEQLATLLKLHDPFAFVVLAHRFAWRLEAILARKFSFISHEDLKDIVAQTMIHAFKTGDRFDPTTAKAITWICLLGHYEALKFLRRYGYLMDTSLDEIVERIAKHIEHGDAATAHIGEAAAPAIASATHKAYSDALL